LVALGYGFFERSRVTAEEITISTSKLPPAIGKVTIAQISDLHLGLMLGDAFLDRLIAKLRAAQPDFIVATGDVLDGQGDDLDEMAARLRTALAGNRAYAIIGNHEYFAGLDRSVHFLQSAGFTVLRGNYAVTEGVVFAGVDDPSMGSLAKDLPPEAKRALAAVQKNAFVILLKHQPLVDRTIPFDLQLSGHVHGGQIFPFALVTRLIYGVRTGLTQLADGQWLYVSRGAGTWGPPVRLLAPPEITLIRVVSARQAPQPEQ
jgi:predicted MPP superfamily phosphohydrolase